MHELFGNSDLLPIILLYVGTPMDAMHLINSFLPNWASLFKYGHIFSGCFEMAHIWGCYKPGQVRAILQLIVDERAKCLWKQQESFKLPLSKKNTFLIYSLNSSSQTCYAEKYPKYPNDEFIEKSEDAELQIQMSEKDVITIENENRLIKCKRMETKRGYWHLKKYEQQRHKSRQQLSQIAKINQHSKKQSTFLTRQTKKKTRHQQKQRTNRKLPCQIARQEQHLERQVASSTLMLQKSENIIQFWENHDYYPMSRMMGEDCKSFDSWRSLSYFYSSDDDY